MDDEQHIEFCNASKVFDGPEGKRLAVFSDLNLSIRAGEFMSIVGPSGCGKSTMLNIIGGFEQLSAGSIAVAGQHVREPGPDRGVVFQDHNLFPWMTVEQNIGFGLRLKGLERCERKRKVEDAARAVGLAAFLRQYPHELSGGMRQRVALARALVNEPSILLLDEPFSALDALTAYKMRAVVRDLLSVGRRTTVMVTHHIDEAVDLSDRVVVMSDRPATVRDILEIGDGASSDDRDQAKARIHEMILGSGNL